MRDGVELATDVHRPDDDAAPPGAPRAHAVRPRPTCRSPASTRSSLIEAGLRHRDARTAAADSGRRGRSRRSSTRRPTASTPIAWCAAQPWSNGRVGMIGGSYVGATQWLPAGQNPPALKAIAPHVTALRLSRRLGLPGRRVPARVLACAGRLESLALPKLVSRGGARGAGRRGHRRAARRDARHSGRSTATGRCAASRSCVTRPGTTSGWRIRHATRSGGGSRPRSATTRRPCRRSTSPAGTTSSRTARYRNFAGMHASGASEAARRGSRLIVGPWSHAVDNGIFAERHYGSLSASARRTRRGCTASSSIAGWAATIPRRRPHRRSARPAFLMGADHWQHESRGHRPTPRCRPGICAATVGPTRRAATAISPPTRRAPKSRTRSCTTRAIPSRTMGGATLNQGGTPGWNSRAWDQRPLEGRLGRAGLYVGAAGAAADRDRAGRGRALRLVVAPSTRTSPRSSSTSTRHGRAEILADGILRLRYRHSLAEPELTGARPRRGDPRSRSAARPTCSGPAIGSGSTSRRATSRVSTPTRTPVARSPRRVPMRLSLHSTASSTTRPARRGCCCRVVERTAVTLEGEVMSDTVQARRPRHDLWRHVARGRGGSAGRSIASATTSCSCTTTCSRPRANLYQPFFESYTTLGAWATMTSRSTSATCTVGNPFRNPGVVAKATATLDHISNGRMTLCLGAGSCPRNSRSHGLAVGQTLGDRLHALDESLSIVTRILAGESVTFDSSNYHMESVKHRPTPLQKHVPVIVGASGREDRPADRRARTPITGRCRGPTDDRRTPPQERSARAPLRGRGRDRRHHAACPRARSSSARRARRRGRTSADAEPLRWSAEATTSTWTPQLERHVGGCRGAACGHSVTPASAASSTRRCRRTTSKPSAASRPKSRACAGLTPNPARRPAPRQGAPTWPT